MNYDHEYETPEGPLRLGTYRNDRNAYVRWSLDGRSGEFGGLTGDGRLVLDVQEYVRSNGDDETIPLPDAAAETVARELDEIRDEIDADMTDDEREAFENDKRIILRAREILSDEGVPEVEEFEEYEFEIGDGVAASVRAEEREGVAEVAVETPQVSGYSPMYDLGDASMSLPVDDWGMRREIDLPEAVARSLLADLQRLQEQLNARREAYTDAVERAREEIVDGEG